MTTHSILLDFIRKYPSEYAMQHNSGDLVRCINELHAKSLTDSEFCSSTSALFKFYFPDLELDVRKDRERVVVERDKAITFYSQVVTGKRVRTTWSEYFMNVARLAAGRTTCAAGRAVGAVAVLDKYPSVFSYNGVEANVPHPDKCVRIELNMRSGEGLELCSCIHAEHNLVRLARARNISLENNTVYVTTRPCGECCERLKKAKIARVIYDIDYYAVAPTPDLDHGLDIVQLDIAIAEEMAKASAVGFYEV